MAKAVSKGKNNDPNKDDRTSNSKARKEIIKEVSSRLISLDSQIANLQSKRRNLINTRIKGDLDMKVADFNAAYRLAKLEREDRAAYLEVVAETFVALGVGKQSDFFDLLNVAKADKEAAKVAGEAGVPEGTQVN